MPNALTMLREDHRKVKDLLTKLDNTTERGTKTRDRLVAEIEMELKIHAQLEEEIFYPAYKDAAKKKDDRELFFEATEEHHVVDMVLPNLKMTPSGSEEFGAKAKVLKDLIEHHIEEEEGQMFKRARTLMGASELNAVGEMMEARRETLVAMWENPVTRPLKKIQGLIQKVTPTKVKNVKADVVRSMRSESRA
jgi:hemerythrin superfamily protein